MPDFVRAALAVFVWQQFKGSFQYVAALPPPAAATAASLGGVRVCDVERCLLWLEAVSGHRCCGVESTRCPLAHLRGTPIYKEARMRGSHCLCKNATLKLLIRQNKALRGKSDECMEGERDEARRRKRKLICCCRNVRKWGGSTEGRRERKEETTCRERKIRRREEGRDENRQGGEEEVQRNQKGRLGS